jgi:hypothetical protein
MIFHKAYDLYRQFAEWTADDVYFITRQKSNTYDVVISTLSWQRSQMNTARMSKERRVHCGSPFDDLNIRIPLNSKIAKDIRILLI